MPMRWLLYVSDYYVGNKTDTILILHQVYICGKTLFNPLALELDVYSLAHHLCKM